MCRLNLKAFVRPGEVSDYYYRLCILRQAQSHHESQLIARRNVVLTILEPTSPLVNKIEFKLGE